MLAALGRLWSAGVPIDWPGFWKDQPRRRVSLPGYPFERQRYWIDRLERPRVEEPVLAKRPNVAEWLYAPAWKPAPLSDASYHHGDGELAEGAGVLFVDDSAVGTAIADALRCWSRNLCVVVPGEEFSAQHLDRVTLRPEFAEDYIALMERLRSGGRSVSIIWHLWGVTRAERAWGALQGSGTARPDMLMSSFATVQRRGFSSLLFLAQALAQVPDPTPVLLLAVTNFAHRVTGLERFVQPAKATVLGPARVIPAECPSISCRSIDVDFDPSISNPGSGALKILVAQLVSEARPGCAADKARASQALIDYGAVAYRGNRRFVRYFEPIAASAAAAPRLRHSGVYLITGGLGGIGLALARHLAKSVRARLVLVSRSSLPEPDAWPGVLREHDAEHETARRIRGLQEVEECGGEVMVVQADVTDVEQMRSAIRAARQRFGPLNAIIHAAGVPGGGLIGLKTLEAAAAVIAPKGPGTLALYSAAREQPEPIDFFALCSSLASLVGIIGQVDYCAANAFLDAFAAASAGAKDGVPMLAINWDTWQEAGMAVNTKIPKHLEASRRESLRRGIRDDEGAAAFLEALASGQAHIAVSTSDLPRLVASFGQAERATERPADSGNTANGAATPTALGSRHARPSLGTPYVAPATPVERVIAEIWQELFGIDAIGVHDDFFELGGHSLLIVQIIARVRGALGVEMPMRALFESPTISGLAVQAAPAAAGAPSEWPSVPIRRDEAQDLIEDRYADVSTEQLSAALEAAERLSP
jgi:NAD(P)-dependent dehydrogenase (short-subunit alcohol dehydrogenase family)/acyl carrier protein